MSEITVLIYIKGLHSVLIESVRSLESCYKQCLCMIFLYCTGKQSPHHPCSACSCSQGCDPTSSSCPYCSSYGHPTPTQFKHPTAKSNHNQHSSVSWATLLPASSSLQKGKKPSPMKCLSLYLEGPPELSRRCWRKHLQRVTAQGEHIIPWCKRYDPTIQLHWPVVRWPPRGATCKGHSCPHHFLVAPPSMA